MRKLITMLTLMLGVLALSATAFAHGGPGGNDGHKRGHKHGHIAKRTLSQNARLWLLHTAAAKHVGCSPDDLHEDRLCAVFGYTDVKMPSGVIKQIPLRRSSELNKKEFREFMDQVEAFYISELGVFLEQ